MVIYLLIPEFLYLFFSFCRTLLGVIYKSQHPSEVSCFGALLSYGTTMFIVEL